MFYKIGKTNPNKIILFPSPQQIGLAIEWLLEHRHSNPDLAYALNLVLQGRVIPENTGELVAISYDSSKTQRLTLDNIQGVVMVNSNNTQMSIESCNQLTAQSLFSIVKPRNCLLRLITSTQVKDWIRPLLIENYQLKNEYDQLVMNCNQILSDGEGRWALPDDKSTLQAYEQAYIIERGSGNPNRNWDDLIKKRQIAVLEDSGQIVSVVRYNPVNCYAYLVAPFTFPQFRRQGFARKLLGFLITELLQEYKAIKLWVDDDNLMAIKLYRSLAFKQIGTCYTGYFYT
ncbi:MAG: GNAT family N-acetyltransferase [Rivularia sp. ALOHA_DT_140]|nr:GNAT family N-acetyltransferase [Rivularia sp. ALOHA_DT_140]